MLKELMCPRCNSTDIKINNTNNEFELYCNSCKCTNGYVGNSLSDVSKEWEKYCKIVRNRILQSLKDY